MKQYNTYTHNRLDMHRQQCTHYADNAQIIMDTRTHTQTFSSDNMTL